MLQPLVVEEKHIARATLMLGGAWGIRLVPTCQAVLLLVVVVVEERGVRTCKLKVDVGADTSTSVGTAELSWKVQ